VYAVALSRLGISRTVFDDLTPLELYAAMTDRAEYMTQYELIHLDLLRYHAVIQRNKGLKQADQIKRPKKYYEFPWERVKKEDIALPDWSELDRKYI
jgi:hypothetical protein